MNRSVETMLRFVNLTSSGLLAGSLGFGEAALVPGWEAERSNRLAESFPTVPAKYFNSIGPVALVSSLALAVASREQLARRALDFVAAAGLAGVLAATMFATVPINRKLETLTPVDYPRTDSESLRRNFELAHAVRTACGIGAFVFAAMSSAVPRRVAE